MRLSPLISWFASIKDRLSHINFIIAHEDDFSNIFDSLSHYCELCFSRGGKGGAYFAVPKDDEYG